MIDDQNGWNRFDNELDTDLIELLNSKYTDEFEPAKHRIKMSLIAICAVFLCVFLVSVHLIHHLMQPSPEFISHSYKLRQNPEIENLVAAVVEIAIDNYRGTGFNIDEKGLIVTNYHLINHDGIITVQFPKGKSYVGRINAIYPDVDLAVISIEGANLPYLPTAPLANPQTDDPVTIIGNPLGYTSVVVEGKVLGKSTFPGWEEPVLVISAPIFQGSSGSPVIDRTGQVIAVIFATAAREELGNEIFGVAVPIHHVND